MLTIIVAADLDNVIGNKNNLLAHLPADMKRFRELTEGHAIVMGSRTYMSFPKRPLPNRENLVITGKPENYPEVRTFCDILDFLEYAKNYDGEIFVCGGGMVYRALMPYCDKALVTRVHHHFGGDTFFPDIDEMPNWDIVEQGEIFETGGYNIQYLTYTNSFKVEY